MASQFVIEDEAHGEPQGPPTSFQEALAELRRRSTLPWDEPPNQAPCKSWKTCGRRYELVEYDTSTTPWSELSRKLYLELNANSVRWTTST